MLRRNEKDPLRLSRLEILGAWTHTWTPHRDAVVPPIPWRKIAIATALTVVALTVAGVLIVPAINAAKDRTARRDARELAASRAAEAARIRRIQRPRFGAIPRPSHFAALSPAGQRAARARLFTVAQGDLLSDARARVKTGEFNREIQAVRCDEYPPRGSKSQTHPETILTKRIGMWDCTAVQDFITVPGQDEAGAFGYPFRLRIDFKTFRYAWCRENPPPGERAIRDPTQVVGLPAACSA